MSRIFLSHSSSNNAAALALASWLDGQGWNDYFLDISDSRGIAPGERWMAALAGAVDRCEAVIFLVSPAWRDSKFCFAEFYQAKNLGKRIFGVIVEPIALTDLPVQMTAEWQLCDLTHSEDPVTFTVERAPVVPTTVVHFPAFGLDALARGLRRAGLDPSNFLWPPDGEPNRSPYPGLRALDEPDAAVFFGRDASIVRAIDQIRLVSERGVERLFVILGASGAGKSSFLRAGLLPRLRRDSDHFVVLPPIRPERAAISGHQGLLASLKTALAANGQASSQAQLRNELADTGLAGVLRRIATRPQMPDAAPGRTVLVLIDQAEELFSSDGTDEARQLLQHLETLQQQLTASEAPRQSERLRVLFVATIRSDSLPRLQADTGLQRLSPVLFSLPAMPPSEFKSVIEGPARRHSETVKPLVVDPQLAEELVADATGADALPLLALTLEWLFREFTTPQGTHIGHDEYKRLGGVRGVINMAVQRALEQPGREPAIPAQRSEQQRLLEQVFPFIATVDPDTGEWKRRVALRAAIGETAPHANALVQRLIEQRLLRADSRQLDETAEPVAVVEVAHEALLRQWDALDRWLRAFAADLAAGEAIRRSAKHWQRGKRDDVLLVHTGHRLQAAEALLSDERLKGRFEPVDSEYLSACRQRDNRAIQEREDQLRKVAEHETRRATLQRRVSWGLSVVVIIGLALMSWIVLQTRDLSRQTSLVFASAAEAATNRNEFDRGVRLAVLAAQSTWLRPADATAQPALSTAADSNLLRVLLAGHTGRIHSASFSPDGERIVTASADNTARVWDAASGESVGAPMKHGEPVYVASFSPDGKRIVTASEDNTARVWDAASGESVGAPMKHVGQVYAASFSPDGKRIVTASEDKTAGVWDAATGESVGARMQHDEPVHAASFSPDGKRVVTASDNETAVWDAATGERVGAVMKQIIDVFSASFSPDKKRVVTMSDDNAARVWDFETGTPVGKLIKHDGWVADASFSPDGKRIVTASVDTTAHVWDAETGNPVGEPMQHDKSVYSASFSPDGQRVVTTSEDGAARVWDAHTGKPIGAPMTHGGPVSSASFSPDGRRVVTTSKDQTARVWDTETGRTVRAPLTHGGLVFSASFSPDGKRVVTASLDHTARVWDAETGKPVGTPMRHGAPVSSARFSPDGERIVTASYDTTAQVWDATTGEPVGEPMKHDWVASASFSPDSKRVVTASWNHTLIWDAATGKPVGAPITSGISVLSASFSPDGKRIVTALADKTARVWDAATVKPIGVPMEHHEKVSSVSFSPDGKRVVTSSEDKTACVWDADTGMLVGVAMQHDGPVSSASFSPDGNRVVTASWDNTARIWDAETGERIGAPIRHDGVTAASFSPDGNRVVTASVDKTARVWDAATGKPVGAPMAHHEKVVSAIFSADGKRVVTASADGTARLWRTDWSMFRSTKALMAAACAQMNAAARRSTVEDRVLAPLISPELLGRDVCEVAGSMPAR